MCKYVNSRSYCKTFWHCKHKFRIVNCYVRCQCIICKRVFDSSFIICNYRKWSYFRTSSSRCCYCNKFSFFTHFRKFNNSLSNIHKSHCQISKSKFWMFIQYPHNFSGVHCRSSTKSDNNVRVIFKHCFCSSLS